MKEFFKSSLYWNRIKYVIQKRYQQNFKNWTSGNGIVDKFIQDTQLSQHAYNKALEWIPYDRFYDIKLQKAG